MRTELVTTLKRRATELLDAVESDRTPILITQHGLPAAYLVDVETYEQQQKLLRVLEGIARGEKAIEDDRVITHTTVKKRMAAMVEIVWTEPALNDVDSIADYSALDKPAAARELVQRVFTQSSNSASIPTAVRGRQNYPAPAIAKSEKRHVVSSIVIAARRLIFFMLCGGNGS